MKVTEAAEKGDVSALRGLLEAGADPNECDEDGKPALYLAVEEEHARLLGANGTGQSRRQNGNRGTPTECYSDAMNGNQAMPQQSEPPFIRKDTLPTPEDPYPSEQETRTLPDGTTKMSTPCGTPQVLEEYERALEHYPDDATLHVEYAFHLHYTDVSKAIEQIKIAIGLEPEMAHAHSQLASYLLQAGETESSLAEYRQALALSMRETSARSQQEVIVRWGLAEALEQSGDIAAARTELQTAIALQREFLSKQRGSEQLLRQLETKLREMPAATN